MNRDELLKPAVDWSGQTWAGRIDQCASMLYCHGYIPASARERIARRLERECQIASCDTHAQRGDSVQHEAPSLMSGAVASVSETDAQTTVPLPPHSKDL